MFQPAYNYFKKTANSNHILALKSKESSDESIRLPSASDNSFSLALNHFNTTLQVKPDGHCLKQDKITFTHKQVVNIYLNLNLYIQGAAFRF